MISPELRKTAELSLIFAVPVLSDAHDKSRLAGLQRTLQKLAGKELGNIRRISDEECEAIIKHITEWGKITGWLNNKKHTGTLLSFIAGMIENSKFQYNPRILDTINAIISHLEAGGNFKIQSCWSGSLAADKWEFLFEGRRAA